MKRLQNLEGQKFNKWTIIKQTEEKNSNNNYLWICRCECGNEILRTVQDIISGHAKGCSKCSISRKKTHEEFVDNVYHLVGKEYSVLGEYKLASTKILMIHNDNNCENHGIKNYIIIDAKHSDMEYLSRSILQSELNNLFDLSNIDWKQCHYFACKSFVKSVADCWNSGIKSTLKISQTLNICKCTIIKYLKQAASLGLCDYSSKYKYRSVVCLHETTNENVGTYESLHDAARTNNVDFRVIHACCKGKRKSAGGYRWMYLSDYEKLQQEVKQ